MYFNTFTYLLYILKHQILAQPRICGSDWDTTWGTEGETTGALWDTIGVAWETMGAACEKIGEA